MMDTLKNKNGTVGKMRTMQGGRDDREETDRTSVCVCMSVSVHEAGDDDYDIQ